MHAFLNYFQRDADGLDDDFLDMPNFNVVMDWMEEFEVTQVTLLWNTNYFFIDHIFENTDCDIYE